MLGLLASAAVATLGALILGQAVLRLCGAQVWSWLSAPVGAALLMLIAVPALHFPGRSAGTAVVLVVTIVAAGVILLRGNRQLPPVRDALAAAPVALLTLVPFVSAERFGTLGWSFNNDMASHLLLAEGYRSQAVAEVNPLLSDYPLGPHALAATLAELLGVRVDQAFAGLTMALPILLGLTALALLRGPRWWGPVVTVTLVGMPFLVAGYYGQGSFKELYQALFTFGVAGWLVATPLQRPALRWVPVALMLAGTVSVYSLLGLAWPVLFCGLWLIGLTAVGLAGRRAPRELMADARGGLLGVAIGAAALAVLLAPQLPRLSRFLSNRSGPSAGIAEDDIGNLAGRIPVWESFGIWGNADYRLPAADQFTDGLWAAFALALVVLGVVWVVRRHDWMLAIAAAGALLIWVVSDRSQSPYIAAKALVILSPLLLVLAVRPLVEHDHERHMPSWWWLGAPLIAAVLTFKATGSSVSALRSSKVGPTAHLTELRALRPMVREGPTLFLGQDDFIQWELPDVRLQAPVIGYQRMIFRPEKPYVYGTDYDIDSLDPTQLDQFDWVIAPRDAAESAMPPELRLVRQTRSFAVYRRTAPIAPRSILAEGQDSTAVLDCASPQGQAIRRAGGVAGVRAFPVGVVVPAIPPGGETTVMLPLGPGNWELVAPYVGEREIRVRAPGLDTTLPANLDRPGTRWPIGRIRVNTRSNVPVRLQPDGGPLVDASAITTVGAVVAVPSGTRRTVPIAEACGQPVDWYRSARP